jgi:hypothetical protein
MRTAMLYLLFALIAAPALAQAEQPHAAKVWTDADLRQPLPKLHRTVDPAILAAFKARSEAIPFGAGGFASYGSGYFEPAQAAAQPQTRSHYERPVYYARQPLYPTYGWPIIRTYGVPARPVAAPRGRR